MTGKSAKRFAGQRALEATSFFMADVQAGIGPFLGVYLQSKSWQPGPIGTVMTLGGIAGMLATGPAGALVDSMRSKRALVVVCSLFAVLASALILVSTRYVVVTASQVATAVAGAAILPAISGITLGIARQAGFDRQIGRNQVANHAGNVLGAALSGYLGWRYGFVAVFVLAAVFGARRLDRSGFRISHRLPFARRDFARFHRTMAGLPATLARSVRRKTIDAEFS